ncbi:MAG: hypothetical protein PF505_14795 [Vallitaleaceae bacterium]|jgi:hypothetical protein|nr:hypothetical protein [Vallitaleaceae bacterium]
MGFRNYLLKGLLIFGLLIFVMSSQLLAINEEDLEVQVELGYDKTGKIGEGNPVDFTVTNHGEDFSGEIQVYIEGTDGNLTIYAKAFDIANNSTKTISLTVPLLTIQRSFDVAIVSGKKTLYEETIKINEVYSPESAAIGVITSEVDQYRFLGNLSYLNTNQKGNYDYYPMRAYSSTMPVVDEPYTDSMSPKAVFLDGYSSVLTPERLSYFDYLYIGRIDDLTLSDDHISALLNWTQSGGILVIESGNQFQKMEQLIDDKFNIVKFIDTKAVDFDMLYDDMPVGGSVILAEVDPTIDIDERVKVMSLSDINLGYYKSTGLGKIVELAVDFGTEPLNSWSGKTRLFEDMMSSMVNKTAAEAYYYEDFYQYQNYLMNVPSRNNAPYMVMLIVLGIYIIGTGPLLYFILKKKDKRTSMWWIIPALSVVSVLAFFLIGFTTRYTKPITNNISTITYEDGDSIAKVDTYMSVLSNKKGDLTISWDREDAFEINSNNFDDYYGYYDAEAAPKTVAKITQGKRINYTIYDAAVWDGNYMEATKTIDFNANDMVNVSVQGSELVIEVSNNLPIALEYAFIKWGNYYVDLGTIEPGQVINKTESLSNISFLSYYEFDESRFGYMNYGQITKTTNLADDYPLRDILNMKYGGNYDPSMILQNSSKVTLTAINRDDIGYELVINDSDFESFHTNIIEINTSINYEPGSTVVFDKQTIQPKVVLSYDENFKGNGYIDYNAYDQLYYINEFGIIELTYELPVDIDLEKLYIEMPMITDVDNYYNKQGSGAGLAGQVVTIYSKANDDFVPFTEDISTMSDDNLKDGNQIVIRIDTRFIEYDSQQGYVEMLLPSIQIQIEGVVKGEVE